MKYRSIIPTLLVPALFACSGNRPDLVPAPGAAPAPPGPGDGAVATVEGVTVEARSGAWRGLPRNLEAESIPLLVEITNDSERSVSIRYNDLQLVAPGGQTFHAIPPYRVQGDVAEAIHTPAFAATRFRIAPYLSRYYPRYDPFTGDFVYDPLYYDRFVPSSVNIQLPTADMIRMALPEGVLEPNGRITGFVYFEDVEDLNIPQVEFTANLVDASTGEKFGTVQIPFAVQ